MNYKFPCSIFFLIFLLNGIEAQVIGRKAVPFSISEPSNGLKLPAVGGLNAPQFSEIDIDLDGTMDLFVFDRLGDVKIPLLYNSSSNNYTYAESYFKIFPELNDWVLLRDFNDDGVMDIFSYSDSPAVDGVVVYQGYIDSNNELAFEKIVFQDQAYDILYFAQPGGAGSNLFVSFEDIPDINDIDGDGDLDILTFGFAGGYIYYYKNLSVEMGYGLDSLIYKLEENCWGGIYESGLSNSVNLAESAGDCASGMGEGGIEVRHAGSTLLSFDGDNDGDVELILGDVSFSNINYLTNGGDSEEAWITDQDPLFPSYNTPVDIPIFPATFYLDLDGDGIKDLIASPNQPTNAESYNVGWLYKNIGSNDVPQFSYQTNTFLVDEMVDLGSGFNPVFVDYNADGVMDIVAGNYSYFVEGGDKDARLFLFENNGTVDDPSYILVDDDWLGMSAFSEDSWDFAPTFGDLDNDGDLDLVVGEAYGNLFFAENTAGPNNPMEFGSFVQDYFNIDVGTASTPELVDIDRDGLVDLVIGERNGNVYSDNTRCSNINLYRNIGTPSAPMFETDPLSENVDTCFGGVLVLENNAITAYSSPTIFEIEGEYEMLVGSESGWIRQYNGIDGNLNGTFNQLDDRYGDLFDGIRSHISLADIDNDGYLEMISGNYRGGMMIVNTDYIVGEVSTFEQDVTMELKLTPNPATSHINVEIQQSNDQKFKIEIYSSIGQLMENKLEAGSRTTVATAAYSPGIYFCKVTSGNRAVVKKFIVQ